MRRVIRRPGGPATNDPVVVLPATSLCGRLRAAGAIVIAGVPEIPVLVGWSVAVALRCYLFATVVIAVAGDLVTDLGQLGQPSAAAGARSAPGGAGAGEDEPTIPGRALRRP